MAHSRQFKPLLALLVLACLPQMAAAYDFMVDGVAYKITGSGTVEITSRGEYSGEISIPRSVTYNDTPYAVKSVGNNAFARCIGLTSVDLSTSVASINKSAFAGCTASTNFVMPGVSSVTTMSTSPTSTRPSTSCWASDSASHSGRVTCR